MAYGTSMHVPPLWVCDICGCGVYLTENHDRWHDEMQEAANRAYMAAVTLDLDMGAWS